MKKYIIGLTLPLLLTGCSGFILGKSNLTPPVDLDPNVSQTLVNTSWTVATKSAVDERSGLRFRLGHEGSTLYAAGLNGQISAIDYSSGKIIWSKKVEKLYSGIYANNGVLLVGSDDSKLLALSATDGSLLWEKNLFGSTLSSPMSTHDLAIARTQGGALQTFDLRTGDERWSYMMAASELNIRGGAKPVAIDDTLLVPNDLGQLGLLSLKDGRVLWGANLGKVRDGSLGGQLVDIDSSPLVIGNTIYAATIGTGVSAVNLKTGNKLWTAGKGVYSGIAYSEGIIVSVEEDSYIRGLSAKDGAQVWTSEKLLGRKLTKPLAIRDRIVVGDYQGYVHVLDARTGMLLGSTKIGKARFLPDIQEIQGAVVLQDVAGKIYKITI